MWNDFPFWKKHVRFMYTIQKNLAMGWFFHFFSTCASVSIVCYWKARNNSTIQNFAFNPTSPYSPLYSHWKEKLKYGREQRMNGKYSNSE